MTWFFTSPDGRSVLRARVLSMALLVVTVLLGLGRVATAVSDGEDRWAWPLQPDPPVVRGFEPPAEPWGPGHRGVDLAGGLGQPVVAVASGTVTFAGRVAGRGVVVVRHGAVRSTYEPVVATVEVGTAVQAQTPIGSLSLVGSHCLPDACLHLGARRGDDYLDPLDLLGDQEIRLKPLQDDLLSSRYEPLPASSDPGTAALVPTVSGAGVGLTIGRAQPLGRDMGVDLGGSQ